MKIYSFDLTQHPLYKKIFFFFLCALPFSLPFPMKLNNALIGATLGIWLLGGGFKNKYRKLVENKFFFLFISLFLLLPIGILRNNNVGEAWPAVERSLSLIIIPLIIFSSAPYSTKEVNILLKSFIVGCFISMIFCIAFAIYKHTQIDYAFEWNHFTVELNHVMDISHPYYGLYLAFAIFSAVYIYSQKDSEFPIGYLAFFIVLSVTFMLAITSKIAFLGLVLISITIGILTIDLKKNFKKILLGCLVFIAFLSFIFNNVKHVKRRFIEGFNYSYDSIANDEMNYSATRMGPLKCALDVISDNWLLGVGTGDQEYMMRNCYFKMNLDRLIPFNTHNQYLDYLLGYGIGGITLFLLCLFLPLYFAYKKRYLLYVSFLLLFILCNCTENMMARNKGIVFYSFFNSLLACNLVSYSGNENKYKII